MRSYQFWPAVGLASTFLVAALSVEMREASGHGGGTSLQPPAGSGAGNGLLPEVYFGAQREIDDFLKTPQSQITPEQYNRLHARAEDFATVKGKTYRGQGARLLRDIIGCSLPSGDTLGKTPPLSTFPSEGVMTPSMADPLPWVYVAIPWPGYTTDAGRRQDVHTCLSARLNSRAEVVRIRLTGAHASPDHDAFEAKYFSHDEAVWLASIEPDGVHLNVWPLPHTFGKTCGLDSEALGKALRSRACGTLPYSKCSVRVHQYAELAQQCVTTDGEPVGKSNFYSCRTHTCPEGASEIACLQDIKPAIVTHLDDCGWNAYYGGTECRLADTAELSKCKGSTP
jgi:hypothetical protein